MSANATGGNGAAPVPVPAPSLTEQWRAYLLAQRRPEATEVEVALPSGMAVRAIRPSLLSLLRAGRVPDTLAPKIDQLIAQAREAGEGGYHAALVEEQRRDPLAFSAFWLDLIDLVWLEAVVEPRFAKAPAQDAPELPLDAVTVEDRSFLFAWAQGVDDTVSAFRDRTARAAAALGDPLPGEGVRAGPAEPARDRYEG